jgi:hypothetical protein
MLEGLNLVIKSMGKNTNEDVVKKYITDPLKEAVDGLDKDEFTQSYLKRPLTSKEKEEIMKAVEERFRRKTPLTSEEREERRKVFDLLKKAKKQYYSKRIAEEREKLNDLIKKEKEAEETRDILGNLI